MAGNSLQRDAPAAAATSTQGDKAADKVLAVSSNLAQLLPTGTVLAYQSLSSSFTNQGQCFRSNFWLSVALVTFLTTSCIFFAFTDSVLHQGKVFYGVARPGGLIVFTLKQKEAEKNYPGLKAKLKKRKLQALDWVHAIFTAVVFLTVVASDVGLQNCFFPHAGDNAKQLLKNMPLGMAVMASFVFMIFPTTRKGIGSQFHNSDDDSADGHGTTTKNGSPSVSPVGDDGQV